MRVRTRAIREGRVLYLLEDVALPEGQQLIVTIEMPHVDEDGDVLDEDGIPIQETLADVLGFDPEDEERLLAEDERQRQALQELVGMFKITDYPPGDTPSAAVHHDKYIYRVDW